MIQNSQISICLTPKRRLEQALKKVGIENSATVTSLAITGRLIDCDMKYIRENMRKTLQELDLSKASFKKNILPDFAFENCTALTTVIFPDTIVEIGYRSFSECIGLKSIFIPASVVKIDTMDIFYDFWAFAGCDALTRIDVHPDNPVFASEDGVLLNKEKTELIKCPNGRQDDYVIPDTVICLGLIPFSCCKMLTCITVSKNNPEYSSIDGVLFNKNKTELICCPEGRQGDYVIPDTVVKIHSGIESCTNLTSIFIPAATVEIGWVSELTLLCKPHEALRKEELVFCACSGLTSITIDPNNPLYSSEDGVLFNKDKTELIVYPKGRQGDYIIPASVVTIRDSAFRRCTGLTSVVIPSSVTEMGCETFKDCTALTTVDIPTSVTEIGACLFWGCTALTYINIPASVVKIGCNVFRNCAALTSIFIPASVIEIVARFGFDRDFHGCPAVITVHPDNTYYTSNNGILSYK